jgi:hypothetical protein
MSLHCTNTERTAATAFIHCTNTERTAATAFIHCTNTERTAATAFIHCTNTERTAATAFIHCTNTERTAATLQQYWCILYHAFSAATAILVYCTMHFQQLHSNTVLPCIQHSYSKTGVLYHTAAIQLQHNTRLIAATARLVCNAFIYLYIFK